MDVDGAEGKIYAKTRKGWNCDVDFFLKVGNEKAVRIIDLADNTSINSVRDILGEYMELDFVTRWAAPFELEPHIECIA